jgi:hypothetical protein
MGVRVLQGVDPPSPPTFRDPAVPETSATMTFPDARVPR